MWVRVPPGALNKMDEYLDILDESGNLTGQKATRQETHKKGLIHQAVHIWIYNRRGQILFQKRSPKVSVYSGYWDISSAGHISSGDEADESALRELQEELGLKVQVADLEKNQIRRQHQEVLENKWLNNEFDHIYFFNYEGDIKDLKYSDGEVSEARFFDISEVENLLNNPQSAENFVPHGDYYFEIIKEIRAKLGGVS